MAIRSPFRSVQLARAAAARRELAGAVVLALAVPLIFLHVDYQPVVAVRAGGLQADLALSDFAVLGAATVALIAGLHSGFAPLRFGVAVWAAGLAFLAMVVAATFYPLLGDDAYPWRTHLATAGKFAEYTLLALAVPLLVRNRSGTVLLLAALVASSGAATAVGVAQFFGWSALDGWGAGRRQPSFLGHHDFAALSGAALAVAAVSLVLRPGWARTPALAIVAGAAGGLGLVVSGSTAGVIGFAAGALAAALAARLRGALTRRRLAALAAVAAAVAVGVVLIRGKDFDQFFRFLGVRAEEVTTRRDVQTYSHRTLLAYIGWRIFLDHPVGGAGWQASGDYETFRPYLDDARREFPGTSPLAFPSPERRYGVQNAYVQALADLGAVGLALFLALLGAGFLLAARSALRGPPTQAATGLVAGLWLLVAASVWTAVGLVAGLPLDGLAWLALGLSVSARAVIVPPPASPPPSSIPPVPASQTAS